MLLQRGLQFIVAGVGKVLIYKSSCELSLFNPKNCGLLGGVFFGETKFVLSNFLSNEDLSILYESWDVQLAFDTLSNAFSYKV